VVLEVVDTFLFDRIYATLLPASPAVIAANLAAKDAPTSTFSSMREGPTPFHFQPASQLLSFEPGPYAYMSSWPRDDAWRQAISLYLITWLFGMVVYFGFATISYYMLYDHKTMDNPRFLKNQIKLEIAQSMEALPLMAIFTAPIFLAEVRGYTKLYDAPSDAPFALYNVLQFPFFLIFTDCLIYLIHRGLHHPSVYKRLHKPHHRWIIPTPFASHAFHPADGFAQSIPYHVFPLLFPLQKFAYIALFVFVNVWTISIHDGEHFANNPVINGAACHTLHHEKFSVNYGQYTTLWDRLGGTYIQPGSDMFKKRFGGSKEE